MTEAVRRKFLSERQRMIGGSDIAGCLGIGWGCQRRVFLEKTGVEPMTPFHGSAATERGNFFEEVAAKFYALKTGRKVRRPPGGANFEAIHDRDFPQLGVHSDFDIVAAADKPPGILSVKVPGLRAFAEAKRQQAPQPDYILQLQFELSVRRREWGSYSLVSMELFDLVSFDIERDDALVVQAREAALDMWKRVEAKGPEPDKLDPKDRRCQRCPFRLNCHFQEIMAMAERGESAVADAQVDASLKPLLLDLEEREQLAEEASALVDEAKDRIREAVGERQVVEVPGENSGWRVYYTAQKGRETFQAKPFAEKCIGPLASRAEDALNRLAEAGEADQETAGILSEVAQLPETMKKKYTSLGKPSRPLRVFTVGTKQLSGAPEQKSLPAAEGNGNG